MHLGLEQRHLQQEEQEESDLVLIDNIASELKIDLISEYR